MGFVELLLIGVSLSMDAFAVAIAKGLGMHRINYRHALVIALFFGVFQALMPTIGWALGSQFASLITPIDHWIAFFLLAFIGGHMLWDAFHDEKDDAALAQATGAGGTSPDAPAPVSTAGRDRLDLKELLLLAIATSIDALAVGITFAFLQVNIVFSASVIGITTFCISFLGVVVGNQFGARWERPSTIAGGIVLILIGLHILLNHLGVLPF